MENLDIWHKFEKQGGKVMHTIRTRNSSIAKACMVAPQLLEALEMLCDPDWYRVDPVGFSDAQNKAPAIIKQAKGE